MKPKWILLAALGAAIMFCSLSEAEARGRIFGRRAGSGGGGGTLSINPNSLPASYAPQATAAQQQCTGPNCVHPRLVAAAVPTYQSAAAVGTATKTTTVNVNAGAASAPTADTSAARTQRLAELAAEVERLTAEAEREKAAAAVAPAVSAAGADLSDAEEIGAAIGKGLAKSLGLEIPAATPAEGSLADVLSAAPKFTATLTSATGVVIEEKTIRFSDAILESFGAK